MASADYFLKLDGIEGESKDSKHKNEIDVESWNWTAENGADSSARGGLSAAKVSMAAFTINKLVDKSSPKLMLACANGEGIKTAELTVRKAGKDQQEYLKIKLSNVMVSKYHINAGNGTNVIPIETVNLSFTKIEQEYKEQKDDNTLGGSVKAGYDIKEMKKV